MKFRKIEEADLLSVENLIRNTIINVNSKDYSKEVVEFMLNIDPFRPRNTMKNRDYFVVEDNWRLFWIIWRKDNEIKTFFVDYESHWKWIWTLLLDNIEKIILENNYKEYFVYSSLTAKTFYEKKGYRIINEVTDTIWDSEMIRYYMKKDIT